MDTFKQLCAAVAEGAYDSCFRTLYVPEGDPVRLRRARDRAAGVLEAFRRSFGPGEDAPAALFAAALLATIPVVILFMLIEKHLAAGLTAGGVKG